MDKLCSRVTALEVRRPTVRHLEDMTDAELLRVITGHQATIVSDEQLARIAQGETWINLKDA